MFHNGCYAPVDVLYQKMAAGSIIWVKNEKNKIKIKTNKQTPVSSTLSFI